MLKHSLEHQTSVVIELSSKTFFLLSSRPLQVHIFNAQQWTIKNVLDKYYPNCSPICREYFEDGSNFRSTDFKWSEESIVSTAWCKCYFGLNFVPVWPILKQGVFVMGPALYPVRGKVKIGKLDSRLSWSLWQSVGYLSYWWTDITVSERLL